MALQCRIGIINIVVEALLPLRVLKHGLNRFSNRRAQLSFRAWLPTVSQMLSDCITDGVLHCAVESFSCVGLLQHQSAFHRQLALRFGINLRLRLVLQLSFAAVYLSCV